MRLPIFLAALLSLNLAFGSDDGDPSLQTLQRALHAMKYGASIKHGFKAEKQAAGRSTPFIEATIAASDEEIESVYAKVLAPHVSRADAEFLLAFYTSATGVQLIADQSNDPANPNPPLRLTNIQLQEAKSFSASAPVARFRSVTQNPALQQETGRQLKELLLK